MKKITILIGLFLLLVSNVFADDVTIDSSGNVKTGVASSANLEVTGASAESAISGLASGTGGVGVSGVNSTYGNYGLLGYDSYGVYGFSSGGYAGYFDGNVHVTGNLTVQGNINVPETDPQVGTLTNRMWCTSNGSQVDCTTAAPVTIEFDPQVGTLTSGKWCTSDGTAVNCASDAPSVPESDPQVGNNTSNYVPKWNGSALVSGQIYDGAYVGIGTSSPAAKLHVAGGGWNSLRIDGTQPFITLNTTDTFQTGIYFAAGGSDKWAIVTDIGGYSENNLSIMDKAAGIPRLFIDPNGNIGIGTTAPAAKLDVSGDINTSSVYKIDGTTVLSAPSNNIFLGRDAGYSTTGYENTFLGNWAGYSNTTGDMNTFLGNLAGRYNTTGSSNTFLGRYSGVKNTTGNGSTFVGTLAGYSNTTGAQNTFIGYWAGQSNTTGYANTFLGTSAGDSNTAGHDNTFLGWGAGHAYLKRPAHIWQR